MSDTLTKDERVCAAAGCDNSNLDGRFVGDFCAPCDGDMRAGKFRHGTAAPYKMAAEIDDLRAANERLLALNMALIQANKSLADMAVEMQSASVETTACPNPLYLPKITPEMFNEHGGPIQLLEMQEGGVLVWTQDAVDFACFLQQFARSALETTPTPARALLASVLAAGHEPIPASLRQEIADYLNGPAVKASAPLKEHVCPTCGGRFIATDDRMCPHCHAREHNKNPLASENGTATP